MQTGGTLQLAAFQGWRFCVTIAGLFLPEERARLFGGAFFARGAGRGGAGGAGRGAGWGFSGMRISRSSLVGIDDHENLQQYHTNMYHVLVFSFSERRLFLLLVVVCISSSGCYERSEALLVRR